MQKLLLTLTVLLTLAWGAPARAADPFSGSMFSSANATGGGTSSSGGGGGTTSGTITTGTAGRNAYYTDTNTISSDNNMVMNGAGGISTTGVISATTMYAVNNLILGNSATTPSLTGKLLIRQTTDGAGLAMRIYNQGGSQFTGIGMDTSSIPCWFRGAACIVNLMSTGLSVAQVSATNVSATGNITAGGIMVAAGVSATNVSYTTLNGTSDRRLKQNIQDLGSARARLMLLKPVSFEFKALPGDTQFGFIAQDAALPFPELVTGSEDTSFGFRYVGLIAPMVEVIQEQQRDIDRLQWLVLLAVLLAFVSLVLHLKPFTWPKE